MTNAKRVDEFGNVVEDSNVMQQTLSSTTSSSNNSSGSGNQPAVPDASQPAQPSLQTGNVNVDRSRQDASYNDYVAAMQTLQQKSKEAPGYSSKYDGAIDAAFDKIMNRGQFQYDLNSDQMYQQYRDKYLANAKLSMQDTMGQAAALTGGYGSSYGQRVGQQAYDAQLQQLNDIVPQLYDRAYGRWQDEGTQMQQQYGMLMDRENQDYGRYRDDLNQWNTDRTFAQSQANDAYSRWYSERGYNDQREDQLIARQDAALNKLMLLASKGYKPTDAELAEAGITADQWKYYAKLAKGSGGGGGSRAANNTGSMSQYAQNIYNGMDQLIGNGKSPQDVLGMIEDAASKKYINEDEYNAITDKLKQLAK